jgi:hypothetical protein
MLHDNSMRKLGIEETHNSIIHDISDKPISNIILNGEKLKPFHLKSERRPLSPLFYS